MQLKKTINQDKEKEINLVKNNHQKDENIDIQKNIFL